VQQPSPFFELVQPNQPPTNTPSIALMTSNSTNAQPLSNKQQGEKKKNVLFAFYLSKDSKCDDEE
jgi:hypothetical protein